MYMTSIRLPDELNSKIKQIAERSNISKAAYISAILQDAVENNKIVKREITVGK